MNAHNRLVFGFVAVAAMTGCREDTQQSAKRAVENAGETVEMAARDVADEVKEHTPKAKRALERAGDDVEDAAEIAARKAKEAARKAADATGRAADRAEHELETPPRTVQ